MTIKNVIFATTGLNAEEVSFEAIDNVIENIKALKKRPILVIGKEGDAILRNCQHAADCELVFDDEFSGASFTSLKAGLRLVGGGTFVLPNPQVFPQNEVWQKLELASFQNSEADADVFRPVSQTSQNEPAPLPYVITWRGVQNLLQLPAETQLEKAESLRVFDVI